MRLKMFCVFDAKISLFMAPFFFRATGEALRAWEGTVNDPKTQFYRYPSDFILFEIGSYEESTGQVEMLASKLNLGSALDFKKMDLATDGLVRSVPAQPEVQQQLT